MTNAALRDHLQTLITPEVLYFPVRHHSPACAWALRRWIREHKPRAVLIEGPDDFTPLLTHLVNEQCQPPVAVYAFHRTGKKNASGTDERHASYYPLCEYSPEWVALREGHMVGAELRFIDLDHATQRQLEHEASNKPGSLRIESLQAEHYFKRSQRLQALARRCNCRDHDELWDHLIEVQGWRKSVEDVVRDVAAYCWMSRQDTPREVLEADGTLAREAVMAEAIRDVLKTKSARPVLVVTGGFHTVVLPELVKGKPAPVERAKPAEKFACLTRYTFVQLDALSGYGAGMPQPGFYQALWQALERGDETPLNSVALHFLVELGHAARARDLAGSVSVADEIAALEQARRLAQLRGHAGPAREDLWDAVRSCLIKGEVGADGEAVLALARKLFTGIATGEVPPDAGVPPLVDDFRRSAKSAKLPDVFGAVQSTALEIYKRQTHRDVSRFLHRLEFLAVPYAIRRAGPDFVKGVDLRRVIEHWDCQWSPQTESTLIERAAYGSSVQEAAVTKLREHADQLDADGKASAGAGVGLLVKACLMGMLDEAESLAARVEDWVGNDAAFDSVANALSQMMLLWQSREPLEARRLALLPSLMQSAYTRACQLLDTASHVTDEHAPPVLDGCLVLRSRIAAQGEEAVLDEELFWHALERILNTPTTPPLLRGAAAGLLHTAGRLDADTLIKNVNGALAPALRDGARQVLFLSGLLKAARELAWHEPRLLESIEALFQSWNDDDFLERLPHLRLALSDLTPRETDRVAALVAGLHGDKTFTALSHQGVSEADVLHALRSFAALEKSLAEDGLESWLKLPS